MTDLADRLVDGAFDDGEESRETKGERTRRRIQQIAVERFGDRGFQRTSVSEIARAAGLTQAAVYAYFDNKDALFRASVDADATGLVDEVMAMVEGVDIRELIPSIVVFTVASLPNHPLVQRVLAGMEPDEVPRLVELEALRRFGALIASELEAAQHAGLIRSDLSPAVLSAGVESIVLGLLFTTVQSAGAATARHIDGVVEALDLMIRPPA